MDQINLKLDQVLQSMKVMEKRFDSLEEKLDNFEIKLDNIDKKYESKCSQLKELMLEKASIEDQNKLQAKVQKLELDIQTFKNNAIAQECYNKRLNLLIHGIEETVWENKEQTKELFVEFLTKGLLLNSTEVKVIDLHRLPQVAVQKKGVKSVRPIIVKLATAFDKHTTWVP